MFLTILTPTYNRAHTLDRLYQSLQSQSCKDFEWLIIDDGSTDETKFVVDKFKKKSSFNINYHYKNNGGKHTAINKGIKLIKTPLVFIVDSDDYLTKNAIKIISDIWNKYKNNSKISSFWFLQKDTSGNLVGDSFPDDELISSYTKTMINSGIRGDKRAVYRTEIRKEFPFPIFEDEIFLGEGILHKKIGDNYQCVFINKAIYVGDYLGDGLTKAGRAMRIKNPLGGMYLSKEFFSKDVNLKWRTKKMILYLTYAFFSRINIKEAIKESDHMIFAAFCLPISFVLFLYWKMKYYNMLPKE